MKNNEHLSLNKTYNKVRDLLCINKEDIKELSKEKIQAVSTNHFIEYSLETDYYFSTIFLEYKDKLLPLYFYQTKETIISNKKYIKRNNAKCFINPLILNFLSSYQIKIDNLEGLDDPAEIFFKITSALNILEIKDQYPLVEGIFFFKKEIAFAISLYSFLYDAIENKIEDKKITDFFSTISFEDEKIKENNNFFDLYNSTIKTLESNKSIRILTSDYSILFDYLTNVLDNLLSRKKTICIVCKDTRDYNILLDLLKRKYLSQLTFKMNKYSKDEILSLIDQPLKTHFNKEQKREFQSYINIKNKIGTLINENITGFSLALSSEEISYLSDKIYETKESTVDTFDVSDYNQVDLNKDIAFFETIKELKNIDLSNLRKNIFFGLTSSAKRTNYDLMMVTMISIVTKLNHFIKILSDNDIKTIKDEEITSFLMFEEYGKEIEIINSYNGFPKKYFEVTITEEKEQDLTDLKKLYQNLSSSSLLLKVLFKKTIFKLDLKKILLDYDLDKGKKKKSISIIYKQLKQSKKNSDYKVLFEIIRAYLKSQKELDDNLPRYIKDYGESVSTMNGVVEIQSNIKYIVSFNRMKKKNPYFSLDNPIIKKCLKDYKFSKKIYSNYLEANLIYQNIKSNINLYIGYFLNDDFDFLTSNFNSLKKHFLHRLQGKYNEFLSLSIFNSSYENSSFLLQKNIEEKIHKEESILGFENYYFTSLVRSYQKLKNKKYHNQTALFNKSKSDFIFSIMKSVNSFERLRQDNYFKILESNLNNKKFLNYRNNISIDKKTFSDDEVEAIKYLVKNRFPISLFKVENLNEVETNSVDTVIVFNSFSLTDLELFSTLRIGNNIMFLSKNNKNDLRISFYPEYQLTSESLYLNQFRLKTLSPSFVSLIKKEVEKRGYQLILNNSSFPIIIDNIDGPIKKVALLPDLFIDSSHQKEVYSSLPKFLMRVYNLPLFYLDTISFALEPLKSAFILDDEIEEVSEKYTLYLSQKQKAKKMLTSEDIYQNKIDKIISSFNEYNSKEINLKLLEDKKYDELFYCLQPVKKYILDEYLKDDGLKKYILYMKDEVGLIIYQGGFYMDISKKMIKFRKSKLINRSIEDISITEITQGIKEFVSSFKDFDIDQLKEIIAELLNTSSSDVIFSLRYKEAISMMKREKIIKEDNEKISLNL